MSGFHSLPLAANAVIFSISALAVAVAGTKLAEISERLALRTGLGQAVFGALLLGGSTSLSGIVTSVTAASDGYPNLAISNAIGSIAAQTAFLGCADMFHARVNLEHAAASVGILMQGTLLLILLAIPIMAAAGPHGSFLAIHPASLLLIAGYIFGLVLISRSQTDPMWRPHWTAETVEEDSEPAAEHKQHTSVAADWLWFVILGTIVGAAGYGVARSGIAIMVDTGLSETVIGGLFTAIATSLAEAVTTIAAVRAGALTLGVSNIIGGNCFDVTVVALSDLAYREGPIYAVMGGDQVFLIALTVILTGILVMGLLVREKHGIANIGLESVLILTVYVGAFTLLVLAG